MGSVEHLYIHIPFCAKVCPYCCFYVHGGGVSKQARFIEALLIEMQQSDLPDCVKTIFVGGGTPSMLTPLLIETLSKKIPSLASNGEFTWEVNPATVTQTKRALWKKMGVNRISLGVQSFQKEELHLLGRQHSPEQAAENFKQLRQDGFLNINIDLIFGLPHQTMTSWQENLQRAVALEPNHLSVYQLTYEEKTPFFERLEKGLFKPDEELRAEMFEMTQSFLKGYGYDRYEISNYARAGFESIHNQAYWNLRDYRGFGPSAVSTLQGERLTTIAHTDQYIDELLRTGKCSQTKEFLSEEILWKEQVMLGLRTSKGVDHSCFEKRPKSILICEHLQKEGLLFRQENRWILTSQGLLVADAVAGEFFLTLRLHPSEK